MQIHGESSKIYPMEKDMHHTTQKLLPTLLAAAIVASCGYTGDEFIGQEYPSGDYSYHPYEPLVDRPDDFIDHGENPFVDVAEESTSSFSMDVNTASYTIMRRDLNSGRLPAPASVRVEEFINFFRFEYPQPTNDAFSINMEVAPSHFGSTAEEQLHLLRIGIRGKSIPLDEMKPSNLVFLIDVSGSMGGYRLELVKESISTLLDHLRPTDTVAIQTYASGSTTALMPTPASEKELIKTTVDRLTSGGGTNGEGGIVAAYDLAEQAFLEDGNNRVLIFTDGDFNVGRTGDALIELIKEFRDRKILLTSVGFGVGGYGDATMERLAREGNGNYFFVDNHEEAKRIFGPDLPSTLEVVAQDARIQVEFDADSVSRYRLIGYEKRVMENEDFDKEETDAAEVGPGHTVTALYELELKEGAAATTLLATVRIRHRANFGEETKLSENFIKRSQVLDKFTDATPGTRFAAAVAEYAGVLRGSEFVQGARFEEIHAIADGAKYSDNEHQTEFLDLVKKAEQLWTQK